MTISERLRIFAQGCRGSMWQSRDETIGLMDEAADTIDDLQAQRDELVAVLKAGIRAAELALFVIRKQGVMPNSSWAAGFKRDLGIAHAALARVKGEKP